MGIRINHDIADIRTELNGETKQAPVIPGQPGQADSSFRHYEISARAAAAGQRINL